MITLEMQQQATTSKHYISNEFGQIRVVEEGNEVLFIAVDVARALGYVNTRDAIIKHTDEEDRATVAIHDGRQLRKMQAINESGLYSLILSSKLESAKRFKAWVTKDVLPTLRKRGVYATDELLNNPDLLIKVATELKQEREQRALLEANIESNRHKVIFADSVAGSSDVIAVGDLARILKQNGLDIGRNRLFKYLRDNDYLIKKGDSYNMPTQKAMNMGLFEVKETCRINASGNFQIDRTTTVTGKGQIYFINKMLERGVAQ